MRVAGVAAVLLGGLLLACSGPQGASTGTTTTGTTAAPATSTGATVQPPTTATRLVARLVLVPVCGPSSPQPTGCDPRPLPGVDVTVSDPSGQRVGAATTDQRGECTFTLAPGRYVVRGAGVPAAATPPPAAVTVTGRAPVTVTIRYESNLQ